MLGGLKQGNKTVDLGGDLFRISPLPVHSLGHCLPVTSKEGEPFLSGDMLNRLWCVLQMGAKTANEFYLVGGCLDTQENRPVSIIKKFHQVPPGPGYDTDGTYVK